MTLLAEDLLLLLLDGKTGKPLVDGTALPRALAGAVLLDLALDGVVEPAAEDGEVKKGRLVLRDRTAPLDPILARATAQLRGSKPMKPERAIEKLGQGLREAVLGRIVERGWVHERKGKLLGIFPTKTWPSVDPSHERVVREKLWAVLVDGTGPEPRTAALVSLLSAVDAAHKVFPDADRKAIRKRAKAVAADDWAGAAVRKAVEAVNAAIIAAVIVPSVAAGGS
ncbi:GPP34 family phosphoprotein [Rhodococcus spelaei]|uniref:GPP34 family phosphoprotein n=1 Tax=Rhodococcus spelaei TaxID=2546320 RepID=A0A541BPH5_9NOCA|nr:GPP34 family phosphoprotein [Rhodococcus spelaei]TQF74158.1 GPP34 family phosphoprotein [Rhodococcus spelaei]